MTELTHQGNRPIVFLRVAVNYYYNPSNLLEETISAMLMKASAIATRDHLGNRQRCPRVCIGRVGFCRERTSKDGRRRANGTESHFCRASRDLTFNLRTTGAQWGLALMLMLRASIRDSAANKGGLPR